MMFKIRIGDTLVLLNADQLNQLVDLVEGTTVYEEKHVGAQLGFVGYQNSYVPETKPYETANHFNGMTILSDLDVNKYATLQAMRNKENQP